MSYPTYETFADRQAEASSKHALSTQVDCSKLSPHLLATMAQDAIRKLQQKANVELGLIRHLLIGRHVREKESGDIYLVVEIRAAFGWEAVAYGNKRSKKSGGGRRCRIGALREFEVVEPNGTASTRRA